MEYFFPQIRIWNFYLSIEFVFHNVKTSKVIGSTKLFWRPAWVLKMGSFAATLAFERLGGLSWEAAWKMPKQGHPPWRLLESSMSTWGINPSIPIPASFSSLFWSAFEKTRPDFGGLCKRCRTRNACSK